MKAVLFDMDGVLVNSEPYHFQVEIEIFKQLNIPINKESLKNSVGLSLKKMWTGYKDKYQLPYSVDWLIENDNEVRQAFFNNISDLKPINGICGLLDALKNHDIKIAVASSSVRSMIINMLKKLNISHYFDYIISGHDVSNGKPAPDIFLNAAEYFKLFPRECLVIEDSWHGILAAKAAGMFVLGYHNPDSGNQDLSQADAVISSFDNISVSFLRRICS